MKFALLSIGVQQALCCVPPAALDIDNVVDRINAIASNAFSM